jgi:tetratricopeptide (TPR) repeat protein
MVLNNAFKMSAELLKEYSITQLESVKTGDKQIDNIIDDAQDRIQRSLDDNLWVDGQHIDPHHGHKIFAGEKQAVKKLQELKTHKGVPDEVLTMADEVILNLANTDFQIAKTSLEVAEDPAGTSEDAFYELSKAEHKFNMGQYYARFGEYDKAIDSFRQSWEHSQKLIT